MDLRIAATWFDQTVASDAYGTDTFMVQLEPLDYYKLDGASVKRRIMTTGPDVTLPARMTVRIDDQVYLVGDKTSEHFQGDLIRNRYVMSGADDLVTVRTLSETLLGSGGQEVWATIVFVKVGSDERVSSLPVPEFRLFFGPLEPLHEHDVVFNAGTAYLVTAPYRAESGLMSAVALRLEHATPEDAIYWSGGYDPVTDTVNETGTNIKVIRMRWAQDFEYLDAGTPKYAHGDVTMVALSSIVHSPKPNQRIRCDGEEWRIVTATIKGDITRMHVRRA